MNKFFEQFRQLFTCSSPYKAKQIDKETTIDLRRPINYGQDSDDSIKSGTGKDKDHKMINDQSKQIQRKDYSTSTLLNFQTTIDTTKFDVEDGRTSIKEPIKRKTSQKQLETSLKQAKMLLKNYSSTDIITYIKSNDNKLKETMATKIPKKENLSRNVNLQQTKKKLSQLEASNEDKILPRYYSTKEITNVYPKKLQNQIKKGQQLKSQRTIEIEVNNENSETLQKEIFIPSETSQFSFKPKFFKPQQMMQNSSSLKSLSTTNLVLCQQAQNKRDFEELHLQPCKIDELY